MYKFHYDYVLKTCNARLLFTDTDSLVYEVKDESVYEQCFKDKKLFDLVDIQRILCIMIFQTKKY